MLDCLPQAAITARATAISCHLDKTKTKCTEEGMKCSGTAI